MDYTQHLHTILHYAAEEATRLENTTILPDHLMLGILRLQEGKAYELLCRSGLVMDEFKRRLDERLRKETTTPNPTTRIQFTHTTTVIMRMALLEAESYGSDSCGSIHLLLAILHERANFPAMLLSEEFNITYDTIERLFPHSAAEVEQPKEEHRQPTEKEQEMIANEMEQIAKDLFSHIAGAGFVLLNSRTMRPQGGAAEQPNEEDMAPQEPNEPESDTPALDHFGRDLTRMAQEGLLDPVIGRTEEILRLEQILNRRKKNNPILIGDAGVGKTAIVEGLAQKWVRSRNKYVNRRHIIALDMASIVAGTTYRGQFEERMKEIIYELDEHRDYILFIDEIHTIIGAGNGHGALDAANILKPALARGEVQCIGATTTAEYRLSIEKDAALERRFQKVMVRPATIDETILVLQGLCPKYSEHHGKQYTEGALRACATLTNRYITDRALPDKAIDAMDEAGARTHSKVVEEEDVARVVSIMSGVPVQRVAKKENEQLLQLPDALRKQVIGQDTAVDKVVRAIRRSRLGLRDPHRPIGTFLFLGSTGVGKTYMAQCLAQEMFGSKEAVIRFDMSEYMEKHTVSLLVGAPPGYIAHEEGGKLTEAVRRRPYSIVLFDEIEKAHPDIFNILLQVLDEGRMTDRQGQTVDFRNTIIILTSNIGTRQLNDFGAGVGFDAGEVTQSIAEQTMNKALKKAFPPEFVNRIDDIITFAPLSKESIAHIVQIEVNELKKRIAAQGYKLSLSANVMQQLLERAYDPKNGARPVKRAVQSGLEDLITDRMMLYPEEKNIKIQSL
ncbi:MAG: ATP-dependent Clp protease ATP-binding subunit [Paludibacteraceae bacterium]|nr:ATP-dependent Clp protease ATP-binding subunit [Paludibacteraceae bacterium]